MSDVTVNNHGSLIGLTVHSDAAKNWTHDNLSPDAQWLGTTVFVEPRYVDAIIEGMTDDGLTVH